MINISSPEWIDKLRKSIKLPCKCGSKAAGIIHTLMNPLEVNWFRCQCPSCGKNFGGYGSKDSHLYKGPKGATLAVKQWNEWIDNESNQARKATRGLG